VQRLKGLPLRIHPFIEIADDRKSDRVREAPGAHVWRVQQGEGKSSPGSKAIPAALLKDDPRPIWIVVNADAWYVLAKGGVLVAN
jgi:hypothetical protein